MKDSLLKMKKYCLMLLFTVLYGTHALSVQDGMPETTDTDQKVIMPVIKIPYQPEDKDTLLVAGSIGESQQHFFDKTVSVKVKADGTVSYIFPDFQTTDKSEALKYARRKVISPFEVDPAKTIYLNIAYYSAMGHADHLFHLDGSIFKITHLPHHQKVSKILIEYLGDPIYSASDKYGKDFQDLDWSWIRNLHNMLEKGGTVYFEMRADEKIRQKELEKQHKSDSSLPILTDELQEIAENLIFLREEQKNSECPLAKGFLSKILLKPNAYSQRALKKSEIDQVLSHVFDDSNLPPAPQKAIQRFVVEKFTEYGFLATAVSFGAHNSFHIPDRFYDVVRIEAKSIRN